jgi:iron(III) transport system ATP-binding protein
MRRLVPELWWQRIRYSGLRISARQGFLFCRLICVVFLSGIALSGCGNAQTHKLPASYTNYWLMPPEGIKIPAPRACHITPQGELYVLDNAGRVLVFDSDGKVLRQWFMPEYSVGKPEKICLLHDGRLAVADTHYHRVVFFDPAGKLVGMMGSYGRDPGEFIFPVALAQDDDDNLYVCEYGDNDRVQKFSPSGIVWHDHELYIVDAFNNRIQHFTDEGEYLGNFGDSGDVGLNYPYDLVRSASGDFYVVEYGGGRVSKFNSAGKLLGHFGETGSGPNQLSTPWGLTVDARNRVWVADTGNRRILEWQL